jgi:hypothetical protein
MKEITMSAEARSRAQLLVNIGLPARLGLPPRGDILRQALVSNPVAAWSTPPIINSI